MFYCSATPIFTAFLVPGYKEALSGFSVVTVDKFQGQEAPIVIYSMTSSSSEDAPMGMSFLYNPNRMNVATSRAKCTSILVSTSKIFEVECNTIEQIRWANGVCLYKEMSMEVNIHEFNFNLL
ncbi:MAG: hypothetical protein E4H43_02150 [Bacteroidia bacterium]|nr:MAG: hypothetical protein E4H43_02150 [Bacteroidia bacterium]